MDHGSAEKHPDPPILAFLDFLPFFVFRFPLLFWAFFLSFPRTFGVPRREKPLLFFGVSLAHFFSSKKKQGLEARGHCAPLMWCKFRFYRKRGNFKVEFLDGHESPGKLQNALPSGPKFRKTWEGWNCRFQKIPRPEGRDKVPGSVDPRFPAGLPFPVPLVAPYCAILRDYLSDTPLLRAMGVLVSQHGQLGAIAPPSFSERFPLGEHAKWRCDTPPPFKRGISAILARYPMKTRQMGAIHPSAIRSRKGIARYGGVSRTGPLSWCSKSWNL